MNRLIKLITIRTAVLLILTCFFSSCEQDEEHKVTLFEPGKLEVTSTSTDIKFGEEIIFNDLSTKVHSRNWVFQGGTPTLSSDPEVTVLYPKGGSYQAILNVVFVDNQKAQYVFNVEVEADPNNQIPEYDFGQTYGLYTEHPDITPGVTEVWGVEMNDMLLSKVPEAYEGEEAFRLAPKGNQNWTMGALQVASGTVDFSRFPNGYYHIGLKSACTADIWLRIRDSNTNRVEIKFTAAGEQYGFKRDGFWHLISIPMADLRAAMVGTVDFTKIKDIAMMRSVDGVDVRTIDNYEFFIDHVFLSEKMDTK